MPAGTTVSKAPTSRDTTYWPRHRRGITHGRGSGCRVRSTTRRET